MIIVTRHICPPIQVRKYDWEAHYDNYDDGYHIGYGATEQQSIDDLNICLGYLRSEIKTM